MLSKGHTSIGAFIDFHRLLLMAGIYACKVSQLGHKTMPSLALV